MKNNPTTKDDALLALMSKHSFVLPRNAIEWRICVDDTGVSLSGSLPTLSISTATLLCTDGIVAYFLLGDDETLFFGHLSAFVPNKKESTARAAGREAKNVRSPKRSSVDAALALLSDFIAKNK